MLGVIKLKKNEAAPALVHDHGKDLSRLNRADLVVTKT